MPIWMHSRRMVRGCGLQVLGGYTFLNAHFGIWGQPLRWLGRWVRLRSHLLLCWLCLGQLRLLMPYWGFRPDNGRGLLLIFLSSNLEVQVVQGKVKKWVWGTRSFFSSSAEASVFDWFDQFHGDDGARIIDTAVVHEIWAEISFFASATLLWSSCWFGGNGNGRFRGCIGFGLYAFCLCMFFQFKSGLSGFGPFTPVGLFLRGSNQIRGNPVWKFLLP